jgi:glycosyltransferase involved in cell wall biosynthesis
VNSNTSSTEVVSDLDWTVAVFAHNEERSITRCLESLASEAQGVTTRVYVLANGCTDSTVAVAGAYARSHPEVTLVQLELGDKANAWNHFVHVIAPRTAFAFFMDGDVEAMPGALNALAHQLAEDSHANAISALPATGRSAPRLASSREQERGIWGCLYCLRGTFVARLQGSRVRMPVGLIREDGFVATVVKWDLEPRQPWDEARVCRNVDAAAKFRFPSLSPTSPRNVRLYARRLVRYSMGHFQNKMLGQLLREENIASMPAHIVELYRKYPEACRLRFRGTNTFFDWLALRRIRNEIDRPLL